MERSQVSEVSVGIDVGTTAIKVLALAPDGTVCAVKRQATPRVAGPHGTEHDPQAVWQVVQALLEQVRTALPLRARVLSVACASMAEEGALIDGAGCSVGSVPAWYAALPSPEGLRLTQPAIVRSRYSWSGLVSYDVSSLVHWHGLAHSRPHAWQAANRWLTFDAFVAYRLSGEMAVADGQASRTGLYAALERAWHFEDVALLGKESSFLPPVVASGSPLGLVRTDRLGELGEWLKGAVVAVGGHDHPVGAWAAGVDRPGIVLDSLGTAESLVVPSDRLDTTAEAWVSGVSFGAAPHGAPWYAMTAGHQGAILQALARASGLPGLRELPWDEASHLRPDEVGVVFEPPQFGHLTDGERSIQRLIATRTPLSHLLRAVIEGFACEGLRALSALVRATGVPVREVRLIGGASAENLLVSVRETTWNVPVKVVHLPEAVAVGAALCGLKAVNRLSE